VIWVRACGLVLDLGDLFQVPVHLGSLPAEIACEIGHDVPVVILRQGRHAGVVHGAAAEDRRAGVLDTQVLLKSA